MLIAEKQVTLKNGAKTILRSPSSVDAAVLLTHLRFVFHESYRNMNEPPDKFDYFPIEEEEKILDDFTSMKNKFMMVAVLGNEIVGNLAVFGRAGEFARFSAGLAMGLQKKVHNCGLGTAMILHALESAKKVGFHHIELTVRTYNTAGIALYEKVDFKRVGLLKEVAFIDGAFCDEYLYQLNF